MQRLLLARSTTRSCSASTSRRAVDRRHRIPLWQKYETTCAYTSPPPTPCRRAMVALTAAASSLSCDNITTPPHFPANACATTTPHDAVCSHTTSSCSRGDERKTESRSLGCVISMGELYVRQTLTSYIYLLGVRWLSKHLRVCVGWSKGAQERSDGEFEHPQLGVRGVDAGSR
jgi:hypothetical protein